MHRFNRHACHQDDDLNTSTPRERHGHLRDVKAQAKPHPVTSVFGKPRREILFRLRLMHPELTVVWADSAYAGGLVEWARTFLKLTVKTVSRPKNTPGFVILPRRWVVERSIAWIMQARRNARDYERLPQHSEALITWAAITLMTRRLTRTGVGVA